MPLTARLAARDNVGYPFRTPLDDLISVHIAVRNAATLAPTVARPREWSACLYFYRVDEHYGACNDAAPLTKGVLVNNHM